MGEPMEDNSKMTDEVGLPLGALSPNDNPEVQVEAKGSATVKDLFFEGNYEDRRKFGVMDIFDTLGLDVSQLLV